MLAGHVLESLFNFIFDPRSFSELLFEFGIGFIIIIVVAFLMELGANVVKKSIAKIVNWYIPLSAHEGGGSRCEADQ